MQTKLVAGRYTIRRELRPRQVAVFEAVHAVTARPVELYLADRQQADWLRSQAEACGALLHPGLVEILDAGATDDGGFFVATPLLHGKSLEGLLLARSPLPVEDAVAIALQACDALSFLSSRSLRHGPPSLKDFLVTRDSSGAEVLKLLNIGPAALPDPSEGAGDDVRAVSEVLRSCLVKPGSSLEQAVSTNLAAVVRAGIGGGATGPLGLEALAHGIERASGSSSKTTHLLSSSLGTGRSSPPPGEDGTPASEERGFARAAYATPVRIVLANGTVDGHSEDISEGGMLVISREPCAVEQELLVRFAIPLESKVSSVPAIVRWTKAPHPGIPLLALGVEFRKLDEKVAASIRRYVSLMGG